MARTTPELVGALVPIDTSIGVDWAIEASSHLIKRVCATAVIVGTTEPYYVDTELELIERWLAAHFYCIADPRAIIERVSSLQTQYENKVDLGLDLTRYGQQAKRLDTAGGLARLDANTTKGRRTLKGGVRWLGTPAD